MKAGNKFIILPFKPYVPPVMKKKDIKVIYSSTLLSLPNVKKEKKSFWQN